MNSLHLVDHPTLPPGASPKQAEAHAARISRMNKFKRILQASSVSLSDLRASSWSGVPDEVRAISWQLLLGYLPTNSERRVAALERKRKEYLDGVHQSFYQGTSVGNGTKSVNLPEHGALAPIRAVQGRGLDEAVWHQISIDVPRTNPHIPLYGYEATQKSLERILYVWAIRHPASGYVQGINDLVTPFWQVFLGTYITDLDIESGMDPGQLPKPVLDAVEADSFWCLTKLLDGIQDNYIYAQPGIHRQVRDLRDLTTRIDAGLAKHLENEGVEFMQFSFRWMNCLLMRELSIKNTIRMWDTYLVRRELFLGRSRAKIVTGRRARVFPISLVCLCSISGKMVRAVGQDGLSGIACPLNIGFPVLMDILGDHDVPSSSSDTFLDRKRRRAASERGIHMAKPLSRFQRPSQKSDWRIFDRVLSVLSGRQL